MANSRPVPSFEPLGSNMNVVQPCVNYQAQIADGDVGILWDIENCRVPSDVRAEDVAGNIRMALRVHPVIRGAITTFSAYGDFNAFPRRLREGFQRTGVKLIDVPNGRKDAADKAILVDMFLFALDNPPPSSIVLISGDVDFASALHILGQRGYTIILVIPSGGIVSYALSTAGKFVWDWPSVARGDGFVPQAKALIPSLSSASDIAGYFKGCHVSGNSNGPNEEETIVYRGTSQPPFVYNCSSSTATPCVPFNLRSQSLPVGLNDISTIPNSSSDQVDSITRFLKPGSINSLKMQLVKLLELSGGHLLLDRVPNEYQKLFARPLCLSEYGVSKLVNLFPKMGDALTLDGKGSKRLVCLSSSKKCPSAPPLPLSKKIKKGKKAQEECFDVFTGSGFVGVPDEEIVVTDGGDLEQFKLELQEILVCYCGRISLGCFEAKYLQRYKKPLDYQRFGVDQFEKLFEKVRDIVVLTEEPVCKDKFLVAVDMAEKEDPFIVT